MKIGSLDQTKLARTNEDFLALLESDADWFARTTDDVRQLRATGTGPYAKLSDDDFNFFVSKLRFNGSYLCGGNYKPLMTLLLTDLFEAFAFLGIHSDYVLRVIDAHCIDHSCVWIPDGSFCMGSICSIHVKGK